MLLPVSVENSFTMYRLFFILSVLLAFASGSPVKSEDSYKLDIIHYNDFHVRFEETSVESPVCLTDDSSCLAGYARLYYEVQTLLKEKPEAIVLNAGDNFSGTYWDVLYKWVLVQQFMNMLPVDAHALGNHEFDQGIEGIVPYLLGLNAPALVANMDATNEPALQGLFKPHIVVERRGRKIGIIGLITTTTKDITMAGDVEFSDPIEATLREAQALTDEGVDIIVVLSHCGLDIDMDIARDVGHYVDVIIGGHTHSVLWNEEESPSGEPISGPYPIVVENDIDIDHKTLIVTAGSHIKYMGNISVYFDDSGNFIDWEGGPIFMNRSIPEDEGVKAMLAPYVETIRKAKEVPVGQTLTVLSDVDCSLGECALGNVIVDALKEFGQLNTIKSDLPHLAFRQRERIESTLQEGTITEGIVYEFLPHNDRIETFELQGKFVLEALERSVMDAPEDQPFSKEWSLQVSGLRVTYDLSKPEGGRIVSLVLEDGTPLDGDAFYQVTAATHLSNGSNGYTMIKNNKQNGQIIGREIEMFKKYIKKYSPLNVAVDGRINFV